MILRRLLLLVLLPLGTALAADLDVEFSGVLVASGKTSVHLLRPSSGASAWIPIGDRFAGYVVTSYEAGSDSIILTKDGIPTRLHLKHAKVKEADPALAEKQSKAVLNNLRQLAAAADQYYLENGKTSATLADLVGPTKYVKEVKPVDGEDYGQLVFQQGKGFTITTASGLTITYTQ